MWFEWFQQNAGRIVGGAIGLLLGIVYLFFGFFQMFIFGMIVFICYFTGKQRDQKVDLKYVLTQIFPDKFKGF
jgi:uncharacterized membrane protein